MLNAYIRDVVVADHKAIHTLNCEAFGGSAEADLVSQLRNDGDATVELVAEDAGSKIVGHILLSPVEICCLPNTVDALSLAPMAVTPTLQRQGIGTQLVNQALEHASRRGHRVVVVLGHDGYYPRFGFCAKLAQPLTCPFGSGDAWMAVELVPGALDGVTGNVKYASAFDSL